MIPVMRSALALSWLDTPAAAAASLGRTRGGSSLIRTNSSPENSVRNDGYCLKLQTCLLEVNLHAGISMLARQRLAAAYLDYTF